MRRYLQYGDLVRYLVAKELKVRYRRSAIGFVWTMLQPLLTMLVLQLVFSNIFRFKLDKGNYAIYALAGILFWNFFSQSITTSMNSLKANAGLLKKLPVPKSVFPVSVVLSGVVNLLLALIPLAAIVLVTEGRIPLAFAFLPVAIFIASAFTLGAGLLLAPAAAFFHDVVEVVGVVLTLMMYMTPVFYPMSIIPDDLKWVVRFNPIRSILEVFRDPIYLGKLPPTQHLLVSLGIAAISLAVGLYVFRKSSDKIALFV